MARRATIQPGEFVPSIQYDDADGVAHDLVYEHLTQPDATADLLAVDVWATWCGPCLEARPQFDALAGRFGDEPRVAFFALSVDTKADPVWKSLAEKKPRYEVGVASDWFDRDLSRHVGVSALPAYLLLAKDGTLVARVTTVSALSAAIETSLAKQRLGNRETRSD